MHGRDIPEKNIANRQKLDKVQTYFIDRECIIQSLNTMLGLIESSLPGTQQVTVATGQSAQLTTNIQHNSPHNTEIGESENNDYQDDREYNLYQLDSTTDIHTDQSSDDEETDPDNTHRKRQRKTNVPADTKRKEVTRARQEQVLKNQ